jgi:hypothetical protein
MTATPRIRYHLTLPKFAEPTVLESPDVIPWVRGYAAALGQSKALDVVDLTAAEDTIRVQMLQVGDQQGWFRFMFQQREEQQAASGGDR